MDAPHHRHDLPGHSQEVWVGSRVRLRALIAEDEPVARHRLQALCNREDDIEIVACLDSGFEALESILAARPNLLFLDVHLPQSTAVELLARDALELLAVDHLHNRPH